MTVESAWDLHLLWKSANCRTSVSPWDLEQRECVPYAEDTKTVSVSAETLIEFNSIGQSALQVYGIGIAKEDS